MEGLTEFGRLRSARLTQQMPRPLMEERIARFLDAGNVCVMATSLNDQPLATPIEYYQKDFIFIITGAATTKVRNLRANPRICIGIYGLFRQRWSDDWDRCQGVQAWGRAEVFTEGDNPQAYAQAMGIYQWRVYRQAFGKPATQPPETTVIKATVDVIAYRDLGVMREGFAPVQIWKRFS
jgi:general stress protein 26